MIEHSVTSNLDLAWGAAAAFLFDFDGVLADSEPLFRRSWNIALQPWGHEVSSEDYWKYWSSLGEGLKGEIRRFGLKGIDIPLARKRQKEVYEDFVNDGIVPLFPLAARLLEMLSVKQSASWRPFCIASNTPCALIRKILIKGGAPVPLIVGGDGLEKKPAPDIFLRASSLLDVRPSSTLVFEDSWKGIAAAQRGGFKSVLVLNDYNSRLDIRSEFVINGIQPILDLLSEGSIQ
ncbi:MAG: HAD-IA family hydrolase [Candidatus Aegiribacteria sp.]|nr:HAD-IA family hydrolase [Candidatus Aegiribacteria sp.]